MRHGRRDRVVAALLFLLPGAVAAQGLYLEGAAVQHEPPAHARRGAGVDLVKQRRAEEVGAVCGCHEVVVRGVEGALIVGVGVVETDLRPGPDTDIVVVVGIGLNPHLSNGRIEGVLEREPASCALDRRQRVEVLRVRAGKEPGAPEHLVGEELRQGRPPEPRAAPDPDAARRRGIGQHRVFGGTVADKSFLIATED